MPPKYTKTMTVELINFLANIVMYFQDRDVSLRNLLKFNGAYLMVEQKRNSVMWKLGLIGLSVALLAGVFFMVSGSSLNINRKSLIKLEKTGQMNFPRRHPKSAQLSNGNILTCGGRWVDTEQVKNDYACEMYDWKKSEFIVLPDSPVGPLGTEIVSIEGGRVMFIGGYIFNGKSPVSTKKTFFYDFNTNEFLQGPDLNRVRVRTHQAILLNDGRVLVAGGFDSSPDELALPIELFDPKTNNFTEIESPFSGRLQKAVLLPDGNVFFWEKTKKTSDIYRFDVEKEIFEKLPHNGTFGGQTPINVKPLPNGRLLVSTGSYYSLVNIDEGTTELIANIEPNMHGNAVSLSNGDVLFTGGQQSGWSATYADLILYQYDENKLSNLGKGSMVKPLSFELPDKKILLLGGQGNISAELLILSEM